MTADGSHYRVIPSKFVVMNLNWDCADKQNMVKVYSNPNSWLPLYLQNYYENGLAVLRNNIQSITGKPYTPEMSKWLFWKSLFDANYLNMSSRDNAVLEVKYVGGINLQSYDQWSGMGYSEVYCYIPNDATSHRYTMSRIAPQTIPSIAREAGKTLEGFTDNDLLDENGNFNTNASEIVLPREVNYTYQQIYEFAWEEGSDLRVLDADDTEKDSFEFNSIVVLYDVLSINEQGEWVTTHSDLPMGIYVCGTLGETTEVAGWEIMSNTFRKFIHNEDIYGSGTSYGLRICSRYLVNPNNDTIKNIAIETKDEGYAEFSRVMSSFADLQSKMDEVMDSVLQNADVDKDLLGIFKNSRTNVPYLKEVEGKMHWFVNGRDLGVAGDGGCGMGGCDNIWWGEDVQQRLDELEEGLESNLRISGFIEDQATGSEIVDGIVEWKPEYELEPIDIELVWTVSYKGHAIYPDEQSINNAPISPVLRRWKFNGVSKSVKYAILALWGQYRALLTLPLTFVVPTYYGKVPNSVTAGRIGAENGGELILSYMNDNSGDVRNDMIWINNGSDNRRIPVGTEIPVGWVRGQLAGIHKDLLVEPIVDFSQSQEFEKALVCIPKENGGITRIYDPDFRAFNYLDDFEIVDVTIKGRPYTAYLAKLAVTVDSFHYRFDNSLPQDDGNY